MTSSTTTASPRGTRACGASVLALRGAAVPEARVVITTAPGEEAQVDYGDGPMVRRPQTGKYRRTKMAPIDLVSALVADELRRRQDRLLERRHKLARFHDPERSLDTFDLISIRR
jgi:hypothetical protein